MSTEAQTAPPPTKAPHIEEVVNPFLVDNDLMSNLADKQIDEPAPAAPPTGDPPPGDSPPGDPPPTSPPEEAPEKTPAKSAPEKPLSRSQLAEQLTALTIERDKVREDIKVYEQKAKDFETRHAELEEKLRERDQQYVNDRIPTYRWQDDQEVVSLRTDADRIFNETLIDIPRDKHDVLRKDIFPILEAYEAANKHGPESVQALRDKIIERFEEEDGRRVFDMVRKIFPKHFEAKEKESHNRENHLMRTLEAMEKRRRGLSDRFAKIGRATPDEIKSNPDDFNSIISAAIGGDEQMLKDVEVIMRRAADATVGVPPLPPGAKPEQIEKHREAEKNWHAMRDRAYEHHAKLTILAPLVKKLAEENAALKKRVVGATDANRPESRTEGTKPAETTTVPKGGEFSEVQNPFLRG